MNRIRVIDSTSLIAGNLILAFAVAFFILPNNILSGGLAGIAISLVAFINVEPQMIINTLTLVLFAVGVVFLGKKFAVKTVASSLLYPLFLFVLSRQGYSHEIEPMLASIYGGLLAGVGLGLVFRAGSSTGGMAIPPLILAKYTKVKLSVWVMVIDALTVLLGFSVYGINAVLVGLLSVWATTFMVDKMLTLGGNDAKQVLIITSKNDEILDFIHGFISRGSTRIMAQGGYTDDQREIILTVLLKQQYSALEKHVKMIDPDAFLIVSDVTEVHGKGFYKV